jgi:hypothetical protein
MNQWKTGSQPATAQRQGRSLRQPLTISRGSQATSVVLAQSTKISGAPPVYRLGSPLTSNQPTVALSYKIPGAPPVYQPRQWSGHARPAVQKKTNTPPTTSASFSPKMAAPPVYRPNNSLPIFPRAGSQKSLSSIQRQTPVQVSQRAQEVTRLAAPPVYRPNNSLPIFPRVGSQESLRSIQRQIPGLKGFPPRSFSQSHSVIQGLIVVDNDLDTSRLMAAVEIYNKWKKKGKPERITTMRHADLSGLKSGEKLYLVAHGSETTHADRTAEELAELLLDKGLPAGNVVKLISCNTGDGDGKSFAAHLGNLLDRKNTIVGIRGLETSEHGHTRASSNLPEKAMEEYYEILGNDKSFQLAEEIAQKAKIVLSKCDEGEVQQTILEAAEQISKLGETLTKKLDVFFSKWVTTLGKKESEYIHPAEIKLARPTGPSGFSSDSFNPDYPGLEFSF